MKKKFIKTETQFQTNHKMDCNYWKSKISEIIEHPILQFHILFRISHLNNKFINHSERNMHNFKIAIEKYKHIIKHPLFS